MEEGEGAGQEWGEAVSPPGPNIEPPLPVPTAVSLATPRRG